MACWSRRGEPGISPVLWRRPAWVSLGKPSAYALRVAPWGLTSCCLLFQDYRTPEINLFSKENGEGTKARFMDSSEDTRTQGKALTAASIIVHSGL